MTNIEIPESVTRLESDVFYDCVNLTNVVIPKSVSHIGDFAFYGCTYLTDVIIPDSVTYIGDAAFMYCKRLENITIPNTVKYIGDVAFSGCPSLSDVYCYSEDVNIASATAFSGPYVLNTTLYVPENVIEKYKVTYPWSDFSEILPLVSSRPITDITETLTTTIFIKSSNGIITIEGLETGIPVAVYTTSGIEVANGVAEEDFTLTLETNFQKGDIAIVKMGAKRVKVVMK